MPRKINLSANTEAVLSSMNTNIDAMQNLMTDLALGREIYDEATQKVVSPAAANAIIHKFSLATLGIEDIRDRQAVRRGKRDHGREWLDIVENTVEMTVTQGMEQNEWFNTYVERMTIGYGDRLDFYSENDNLLFIAKAGESHHDHILQRLSYGEKMSIPTERRVVKIGADINRFLLGDVDWSRWIQSISKSYVVDTQYLAYNALGIAVTKLPVTSGFIGTGALNSTNKPAFDAIIANVQAANEGADVSIFGTKAALKKINALADVDWASIAQKDSFATTGLIGMYEGTPLVEIPQRFKDRTMTDKLFDDRKLYIMPLLDNKMVKMVDEGTTEITEVTEKGEEHGRWDDLMTYEVQRRYGCGVVCGRYFGQWTLPQQ